MNVISKCDGNVLIVEDFLSQEEVLKMDSFMRNFDYDNLKEHEFKYWGKRLINDHQMKLNPSYAKYFTGKNKRLFK
jgi:ketopantoate hydroxymethyltransferase